MGVTLGCGGPAVVRLCSQRNTKGPSDAVTQSLPWLLNGSSGPPHSPHTHTLLLVASSTVSRRTDPRCHTAVVILSVSLTPQSCACVSLLPRVRGSSRVPTLHRHKGVIVARSHLNINRTADPSTPSTRCEIQHTVYPRCHWNHTHKPCCEARPVLSRVFAELTVLIPLLYGRLVGGGGVVWSDVGCMGVCVCDTATFYILL